MTDTAAVPVLPAEDELSGEVVAIHFRRDETGFSILGLRVPVLRDPVTVVGTSLAQMGEHVLVRGKWKQHPKFGRQLEATTIIAHRPTSAVGIERYLASGVIKGVGPALAARIVKALGEDTFRVLEEEPQRVAAIPGIGAKRAEEIARVWNESQAERRIQLFLAGHNIVGALAHRIMRCYGGQTIEVIESDPYRLARDVRGIGFTTADAIARQMGVPETAPERIEAGLRHVVTTMAGQGHCGLGREAFLKGAREALGLGDAHIVPVMDEQLRLRDFMIPVILPPGERFIFDRRLFEAEGRIVEAIQAMTTTPPWCVSAEQAHEIVRGAEAECGVELAPEQRAAVEMALRARISVLTGGPGTGKTSTLKVILAALREVRARVLLGAPTGKAAKRMRESTGHQASTVARLIGMGREEAAEDVSIDCDILVIDESSMVDIPMLDKVLACLETGAAILFVGDVDQLPSVGPGRVLADLIDSGEIATTRLTRIFRQAATSAIIRNAHRINRGEAIEPRGHDQSSDFHFIEVNSPEKISAQIAALVQRHIPERVGIPSWEVQVLSPMRKSMTGTEALNALLQDTLNPDPTAKIEKFGRRYGVGDRVLQTVNNYDLGVMNGESGIIRQVDHEAAIVSVQVDETVVEYPFADLDQLDLAYAMTVHKSQGSQFPAVVMPVTTQHFMMLQRPIVYTGITRASKFCVLVGQRRALDMAIKNARLEPRVTSLGVRLASTS